jgi:hypothetical protein
MGERIFINLFQKTSAKGIEHDEGPTNYVPGKFINLICVHSRSSLLICGKTLLPEVSSK